MAFPSVVNSAAANSGANVTSWTFNWGFTATSGNLLVFCFSNDGTTDTSSVNNPADWTFLGGTTSASQVRINIWTRIADGTETGVTLGYPVAQGIAATIHEFSGHNGISDVAISTLTTGSNTSPNPGSLNPAGWGTEDTAWMAICGWDANPHLTSYPANYTVAQQSSEWDDAANGCGVASAVRTNSQLASEDPGAFTIGSDDWIAATVAIRPTAATPVTGTVAVTLGGVTSTASGTGAATSTAQSFNLSQALASTLAGYTSLGG